MAPANFAVDGFLAFAQASKCRSGEDKALSYGSFLFLFVTDGVVKKKKTSKQKKNTTLGVAIATMRDVSAHKQQKTVAGQNGMGGSAGRGNFLCRVGTGRKLIHTNEQENKHD